MTRRGTPKERQGRRPGSSEPYKCTESEAPDERSDEHLPRHSYCGQSGTEASWVVAPATSQLRFQFRDWPCCGSRCRRISRHGTRLAKPHPSPALGPALSCQYILCRECPSPEHDDKGEYECCRRCRREGTTAFLFLRSLRPGRRRCIRKRDIELLVAVC